MRRHGRIRANAARCEEGNKKYRHNEFHLHRDPPGVRRSVTSYYTEISARSARCDRRVPVQLAALLPGTRFPSVLASDCITALSLRARHPNAFRYRLTNPPRFVSKGPKRGFSATKSAREFYSTIAVESLDSFEPHPACPSRPDLTGQRHPYQSLVAVIAT